MDDQNANQNKQQNTSDPIITNVQSSTTTQIDQVEQEELNEVKNLEQEEQLEAQKDAEQIDVREKDGKELEEEEQKLPADQSNQTTKNDI